MPLSQKNTVPLADQCQRTDPYHPNVKCYKARDHEFVYCEGDDAGGTTHNWRNEIENVELP